MGGDILDSSWQVVNSDDDDGIFSHHHHCCKSKCGGEDHCCCCGPCESEFQEEFPEVKTKYRSEVLVLLTCILVSVFGFTMFLQDDQYFYSNVESSIDFARKYQSLEVENSLLKWENVKLGNNNNLCHSIENKLEAMSDIVHNLTRTNNNDLVKKMQMDMFFLERRVSNQALNMKQKDLVIQELMEEIQDLRAYLGDSTIEIDLDELEELQILSFIFSV